MTNFSNLESVVDELKSRPIITEYLEPAKHGGYCCIGENCTNGRGKNATGANLYRDNTRLHCHVCGGDFSNIDVIAHHLGLSTTGSDFIEILKFGYEHFGINADWNSTEYSGSKQERTTSVTQSAGVHDTHDFKELELIRADIAKAQTYLANLPEFARRGLSLETLQHFGCGFLDSWTAPKIRLDGKNPPTSRRFIIPTSERHYLASAIDRDKLDKQWWKMHAGSKEIFNAAAITADSATVIVVEGEIDAMSIWQATSGTIPVIAIGGAAGKIWIDSLDLQLANSNTKPPMLIMFDDDEAGRKDAPVLRDELIRHGYPAVFDFLPPAENGQKQDANDILQRNGEKTLSELVRNALKTHENALQALQTTLGVVFPVKDKNPPKMPQNASNVEHNTTINFQSESNFFLHDFENNIASRQQFAQRKTGFSNLDTEDYQIFLPGVYILGGLPSIGKTTFAWQLLEQCADAGEHCLYISYEMGLDQLRAKTLARALWLRDRSTTLTAAQISIGGYNSTLLDIIAERKKSSRDFRAVKLTMEGLNELLPSLEIFCESLDKPPIIAIDYLQRLPFPERERRDGISNNVRKLKDFQLKTGSTIIALSSLNRDNYSMPVSFESFKETGEIEYSADVMWGLQLYYVNRATGKVIEDRLKFEEAKKESPRKIQLKCIKNREGNNYDCFFFYHSAHDHFEPCEEATFQKCIAQPESSTPLTDEPDN